MNMMLANDKPTTVQIDWLARVLGREVWAELSGNDEFKSALETSLGHARRVALHHLADKELAKRHDWAVSAD